LGPVQVALGEAGRTQRVPGPAGQVPVVAEHIEVPLGHVPGFDGPQRVELRPHAEQVGSGGPDIEGERLRQVAHIRRHHNAARAGRSSPVIRRSRVDLPDPFAPTKPVRPRPKAALMPVKAVDPSGQVRPTSASRIIEACAEAMVAPRCQWLH
jgi:hypothetical protein